MARKPVVVVTGASKGLGLAVTKLLLEKFGSIVVAIARTRTPELQTLSLAHGSALLFVELDVTDAVGFEGVISTAKKTFGHIDSLVLNAAVFEPTGKITSEQLSVEAWKQHFDVNFFSQVNALRTVIPWMHMNEGDIKARVIFVSSGSATGNTYGWAPYNTSKAAVNSLCRTLAQEEPDIVSVALRPGRVDTAMQAQIRQLAGTDIMRAEDVSKYVSDYDEGRLVDPMESGHVLASMAVNAGRELSGKFVSWDSEEARDFWDSK
ncbi:uncharacterized protein PHACADRAFT_205397 [Phanerochaete carnosa HHB-10118-sp]|uniref:Uncharacterized protein n=1 Tax=Phanerochaete carnosa (strain HHB-10118-sp) TaxID=650164 RepID=K5WJB3_PHACS|nr:uncharacterized protein PHACADRAFT_205397 [Phanerochaete carnosa HHB-10118-sp]EKM59219.1 hypothetical protein PHACADRAFT_205397 [Phanerochaete carnosa HHB-10118-sp]